MKGRWREGATGTCYMRSEANKSRKRPIHKLKKATGLAWKRLSTSVQPAGGTELDNPRLASALKDKLASGEPTTFTAAEWAQFDVPELRKSHWVRVATTSASEFAYFKPAAVHAARSGRTKQQLMLREGSALTSEPIGSIPPDSEIVVITLREEEGKTRMHVYKDESPRGIAARPLGWVTAETGGKTLVEDMPLITTLSLSVGTLAEHGLDSPQSTGRLSALSSGRLTPSAGRGTPLSSARRSTAGTRSGHGTARSGQGSARSASRGPSSGSLASQVAHDRISRFLSKHTELKVNSSMIKELSIKQPLMVPTTTSTSAVVSGKETYIENARIEDTLHLRLGVRLLASVQERGPEEHLGERLKGHLHAMMTASDNINPDEQLEPEEFEIFVKTYLSEKEFKESSHAIKSLFNAFDFDDDGHIDRDEFETACKMMIRQANLLGPGRVTLDIIEKAEAEGEDVEKALRENNNAKARAAPAEGGGSGAPATQATGSNEEMEEAYRAAVEYEKARMELLSWAMGMKAANLGVLLKARGISMDQVLLKWGGLNMKEAAITGSTWVQLPSKPTSGSEIVNERLSVALAETTVFTPSEFDDFKLSTALTADSFIQSSGKSGKYFKPSACIGYDLFKSAFLKGVKEMKLDNDQLRDAAFIRFLFDTFDADRSGELDLGEINGAMRLLLKSDAVKVSKGREAKAAQKEKNVARSHMKVTKAAETAGLDVGGLDLGHGPPQDPSNSPVKLRNLNKEFEQQ